MKKVKVMLKKGSVQRYLWLWQANNGRKLTIKELAGMAGLSPNTVDKYLNDRLYRVNMDTINKLANALSVEPGELLEEVEVEGNKRPPQRIAEGAISLPA